MSTLLRKAFLVAAVFAGLFLLPEMARADYWNNYWRWHDGYYAPYYRGHYRAYGYPHAGPYGAYGASGYGAYPGYGYGVYGPSSYYYGPYAGFGVWR